MLEQLATPMFLGWTYPTVVMFHWDQSVPWQTTSLETSWKWWDVTQKTGILVFSSPLQERVLFWRRIRTEVSFQDYWRKAASFQSKEFNILCRCLNWILEIQWDCRERILSIINSAFVLTIIIIIIIITKYPSNPSHLMTDQQPRLFCLHHHHPIYSKEISNLVKGRIHYQNPKLSEGGIEFSTYFRPTFHETNQNCSHESSKVQDVKSDFMAAKEQALQTGTSEHHQLKKVRSG